MTLFVDTAAWYALIDRGDTEHANAVRILQSSEPLITSSLVMVETWLLLNSRLSRKPANTF